MKVFYKPAFFYLILDLLILIVSLYVVLAWFPLTTNSPFTKYSEPSVLFLFSWLVFSFFFNRYRPLRKQQYFRTIAKLFYVSAVNFLVFMVLIHYFFKPYSGFVLLAITIGTFLINYLLLSLYFAYRLAIDYNEVNLKPAKERVNAIVKPANPLDKKSYSQLRSTITKHSDNLVLNFLKKNVDLRSGNTLVFVNNDVANLQMIPNYQYSHIIQLERLNDMRNINKKLSVINEKLPDNGYFICCFESKSTRKKRILDSKPKGLNYIFYFFDFLYKRVMPKIFLTKGLYYFLTAGNNRIFSKVEVLGRLYCYGFRFVQEKKINNLTYIVAQRVKEPTTTQKRIYGPLIRLRRYGRGGEMIEVYKLRTMHPFSEYLQDYIYERNNLSDGGKFYKDIRITTIGHFVRKYWLDELPMVFNLLNGEMKLVGVRPLSRQYFNLYSKKLQVKRTKFKPGLLPPFYADMPGTLEEIQNSEMKYLVACETQGVFITDLKYLIVILKNIFINKARSN